MDASYFQQEWQFKNRVYTGQITAVHAATGTCSVILVDGLGIKEDKLELPLAGISIQGHKSAWIRFMPQKNDCVSVEFGPRGDARIIGYVTQAGEMAEIVAQKTKSKSQFPYGDFRELRGGEWDMRSSGGAYLYGSRDGALLLSAGPTVQSRFNKGENDARHEAGLIVDSSTGSFVKFGDVKRRLLPTDFKEYDVSSPIALAQLVTDPIRGPIATILATPIALDAATKEHWVHLESAGLIPEWLADEQFGACRDGLGIPYTGPLGLPLRHRKKIYGSGSTSALSTEVFSSETDVLGNVQISNGPLATTVEAALGALTSVDVSTGIDITLSAGVNAELSGTASAKLTSDLLAQINAAFVYHGDIEAAAFNPIIKGTELVVVLSTLLGVAAAQFTVLAGIETPITPKGAAYTALAAACTAAALALPATLSTKNFVE